MKKFKLPLLSLMLYIIAGLLAIYGIWTFTFCYNTVKEAISSGQITFKGNEYDIITFYMSTCSQYLVNVVILAALGRIAQKVLTKPKTEDNVEKGSETESGVNKPLEEDFNGGDEIQATENEQEN